MLLKVYNCLDSHREASIPEAISHLLNFDDYYTEGVFTNINATLLLYYTEKLWAQLPGSNVEGETFDASITLMTTGYKLVSPFDDYCHRGEPLYDICLYDYCSLFYKSKGHNGIRFATSHPQSSTHCQILRHLRLTVPNLLGRILFLSKDSKDDNIISALNITELLHYCLFLCQQVGI
jgi:hypothetical protein